MIKAVFDFIVALIKLLKKTQPELIKPTSTEIISLGELHTLLRKKFPEQGEIYLSDHTYKLCNVKDIKRFLSQDDTNKMGYIAEERDCDDHAYRLLGQFSIPYWSDLAFGLVWTDLHSLNCFISEDKKFYFIEPQQDTIQEELHKWQGTTIRFIVL